MSPDAQHTPPNSHPTLKDARTQPMPAKTNDQNPFGEGDLNQELIDQMLNGSDPSGTVQPDTWADETLQAEIDVARGAPAPTAVHPIQFMPLTPEVPSLDHG